MGRGIIYNKESMRTRPAPVVKCSNCGGRFSGTDAFIQIIDSDKGIWTTGLCNTCENARRNNRGGLLL